MDTPAIRNQEADKRGLEAWINPASKEQHFFVIFPVENGRMPRSINAEVEESGRLFDLEVFWMPEKSAQLSPPNLEMIMRRKNTENPGFPQFVGEVGDFKAHVRWLLSWLLWTLVEVHLKWGNQ